MKKVRVGIAGVRGHVGSELVRLLAARDDVEFAWVTSRATGPARELLPHAPADLFFSPSDPTQLDLRGVDVIFLALPNGEAQSWVSELDRRDARSVVIDLSADHRTHPAFTYGLPERKREALRQAKRIANPGCYATAIQIAVDPLVALVTGPVYAFGVSGYSGAGTAPSPRNDREVLRDNLLPYNLVDHVHERELAGELGVPVRLLPHVAPFFRGLSVTVTGKLREAASQDELVQRLTDRWDHEPLVRVMVAPPLVRDIAGRHDVAIGGLEVGNDGRSFALVATIDNLLGGAATLAVRNMNLAIGTDELAGVPA